MTAHFTKGELADLKIIGEAWGVSVPDVMWVVLATWISDRRDRDIMRLPYRLRSQQVLRAVRGSEEEIEEQRREDQDVPPQDD